MGTGTNFNEVSNFTRNFLGHKVAYEDAEELAIKEGIYFLYNSKGVKNVHKTDWIVKDTNGEFYSCNSQQFKKFYEEIK